MTITIQKESLTDIMPEWAALTPQHWEELALFKDRVPLDPDFERYAALDANGALLTVTIRDDGVLVGYFIGFVAPGLHYKSTVACTMDIFWVHPGSRGHWLGVKLFREAIKCARDMGARQFYVGAKLHKDASVLFDYLRMTPVETHYGMWIGD